MGALLGVTSPDPDGAGAMKMRAIQYSYNSQGQLWLEALGTVTGITVTVHSIPSQVLRWNYGWNYGDVDLR